MLHVVTTGAYYPPVVTTWKILTTGASQLTAVSLCTAQKKVVDLSDSQNEKALAGEEVDWLLCLLVCWRVIYLTGGCICLFDVILFLLYSKDG